MHALSICPAGCYHVQTSSSRCSRRTTRSGSARRRSASLLQQYSISIGRNKQMAQHRSLMLVSCSRVLACHAAAAADTLHNYALTCRRRHAYACSERAASCSQGLLSDESHVCMMYVVSVLLTSSVFDIAPALLASAGGYGNRNWHYSDMVRELSQCYCGFLAGVFAVCPPPATQQTVAACAVSGCSWIMCADHLNSLAASLVCMLVAANTLLFIAVHSFKTDVLVTTHSF